MGTSTRYTPTKSPPWPELKAKITRTSTNSARSRSEIKDVVSDYIKSNGGAKKYSSGKGTVGGSAGARTASRIGGFISTAASSGLNEALRQYGLEQYIGKPIHEILAAIQDQLGGPANSIDDVDARNAISKLNTELFEEAETADDIEKIMNDIVESDQLEPLLQRFFAHYLYEQFCRVFYEQLVTKVGQQQADNFMKDIFDYIKSSLQNLTYERNIKNINWHSSEGRNLAQQILNDTLVIFGG